MFNENILAIVCYSLIQLIQTICSLHQPNRILRLLKQSVQLWYFRLFHGFSNEVKIPRWSYICFIIFYYMLFVYLIYVSTLHWIKLKSYNFFFPFLNCIYRFCLLLSGFGLVMVRIMSIMDRLSLYGSS